MTRGAAEEAEQYAESLAREQRKEHGAWFTPMALAAPTTRRALAPLLAAAVAGDRAPLRIVDPAVGGGAFLLAALHELRAAGLGATDALACLHGLDVDATAAALAANALRNAAAAAANETATAHALGGDVCAAAAAAVAVAGNVRAGDGLRELEPGTFDVVLTNPPWETLQATPAARARVAELRPHFVHQGRGKLYTYRLFVERALALLRPGGRLGLIVPASLWFDRDAEPLRRLLLDTCDWEWLFGFTNTRRVFAIDGRYRFGALIATKGGATSAVRVAFHRTELAAWAASEPAHVVYTRGDVAALSPGSGAFVEVDDRRDLDVLRRMHAAARPLLGPLAPLVWRQGDLNMTDDRARFVLRAQAEADGWSDGGDGVWRRPGADDLLPLYQGAMVHDLHANAGAHAGGTGRATAWCPPADPSVLRPAFLVPAAAWRGATRAPVRIVHRALTNATNERTMLACLLPDVPCGNSLGVLAPRAPDLPLRTLAATAALLSSLAFDWALRLRLGGTNLNAFVLRDCVLPPLDDASERELAAIALRLCAAGPWQHHLLALGAAAGLATARGPALATGERRALATRIDVLSGRAFGLARDDVAWLVRDCDRPADELRIRRGAGLPPKGFWRVERTLPAAKRRPNRWLAALA